MAHNGSSGQTHLNFIGIAPSVADLTIYEEKYVGRLWTEGFIPRNLSRDN